MTTDIMHRMENYIARVPYLVGKKLSSDDPSYMQLSDAWIFKRTILGEMKSRDERVVMRRAIYLAQKEHRGQRRREGVGYIIHPLRATLRMIQEGRKHGDEVPLWVAAAEILHDTIEDSATNKREQKEIYTEQTIINTLNRRSRLHVGEQVSAAVYSVTKNRVLDAVLTGKEKVDRDQANYQKLAHENMWFQKMKIHDRIDNLLSLPKESLMGVSPKVYQERRRKREEQLQETRQYILPLATSYTRELLLEAIAVVEASTKASIVV